MLSESPSGVFTGYSQYYSYYPSFIGVLEHEREHAINGSSTNDPDGDRMSTAYENNTSNTDPEDEFSARVGQLLLDDSEDNYWDDGQVFADHKGYPAAKDAAKVDVVTGIVPGDWADPGSNKQ